MPAKTGDWVRCLDNFPSLERAIRVEVPRESLHPPFTCVCQCVLDDEANVSCVYVYIYTLQSVCGSFLMTRYKKTSTLHPSTSSLFFYSSFYFIFLAFSSPFTSSSLLCGCVYTCIFSFRLHVLPALFPSFLQEIKKNKNERKTLYSYCSII